MSVSKPLSSSGPATLCPSCYFDCEAPSLETQSDPALTQADSITHVKVLVAFQAQSPTPVSTRQDRKGQLTLVITVE